MSTSPSPSHALPNEPALLLRDDADGVATLTLNRSGKYNTLSAALLTTLQEELDAIAADPGVRVVVIAGAGKAFCAGHDLKEMRSDSSLESMRTLFDQCSAVMMTLVRLPQPVIAKIHGIATAAGCQLVAMCDMAVASDDARFATSGISIGLFCSTPMVALTRNVGRKKAFEMLMTGDFIDAETALDCGLVNRVVPADALDAAVAELAGTVAQRPPGSIALGKRLFYRQIETTMEEAYGAAAETMACNMQDDDTRNGIDAFIAKRPMPPWTGR